MPGLAAADAYTGVRSRVRKALLDAPEKIYVVPFMSEYFGAFKTSLVTTIMGSLQVWRRTKAVAYPEDWILTRLACASASFNIRCECIAVAAKHYGPGGHGIDERKRLAKEAQANRELANCFGVSSIKDRVSAVDIAQQLIQLPSVETTNSATNSRFGVQMAGFFGRCRAASSAKPLE
ncbi:unnamed protein product [Symbiodinium microadriaticum]|nr:unnamed protein product [Symbiodinium microadriaticum]CAE7940686.1 unnamed protein product [Symbiodinium sp. KB8]